MNKSIKNNVQLMSTHAQMDLILLQKLLAIDKFSWYILIFIFNTTRHLGTLIELGELMKIP